MIRKLLAGVEQPGTLVLLSGPAGFGKTTLISELAARLDGTLAWVSLDDSDNDPIRFWTYFITACASIQPGVGDPALALLQSPQLLPDEAVPAVLVNDLARLDEQLVLVLDDYHTIRNSSIHAGLAFLLDHLPERFHLVCSTRVDPPWPLARFRARNRLAEIRAADLRFTTQESAEFLNRLMGLDLSAQDVTALEARTEGWIAGLQLAALSMRGREDISGFIRAFTGSHIYVAEYLVEEVLRHQPEVVQDFLLQTSILERLNAALCEAVTGFPDGQGTLVSLLRQNLFVLPLDDDAHWFRYHQLFADLLKARLQQAVPVEKIETLHRRASEWHEEAGMTAGAVEHALAAGDYAHALRLVEKSALPMILQAYVRTVEDWLQAIPPGHLAGSPRANMAWIWLHLLRGTFAQASPCLDRTAVLFSNPGTAADPSLRGEWLAIQSKLLTLEGKSEQARDLANQALQIIPAQDASVRSMLYVNLATACQQMLDYDSAAEAFSMIVRDARLTGNVAVETLGISGQAQMLLQQGRLHLAFEIASEGVKRLEAGGRMTPFGATLYGELGQIHYHWHQLDQARLYFQRSIQTSGLSGYSDPEIFHHIVLSRISQMAGDWEASASEMKKAAGLAQVIPPAMIREEVISQQVRVDLARGDVSSPQAVLQSEGFSFDRDFRFPNLAPGSRVTHPLGLLYNSALRVLLFRSGDGDEQADLKQGVELAGLVLAGELQCRHIPIALETLLLRGRMHLALGDQSAGMADFVRAVELAEPEGFISVFLEEGESVAVALGALLQRRQVTPSQFSYVREVLAAFPRPQAQTAATRNAAASSEEYPVQALTPREFEILQRIAAGDSNQAIADRLVITLSAVKKHTGNIFNKLNVNSRTQAIALARRLEILPPDQ